MICIKELVDLIVNVSLFCEKYKYFVMCSFQVICIYINSELEEIECVFDGVFEVLVLEGCLFVISFYFFEDCIVKNFICYYSCGL